MCLLTLCLTYAPTYGNETLDLCWDLMQNISTKYLVRLDQKWIDKYHPTEKK